VKRQLCILKKVSRASLYQTIDPSALPCFVVLQLVQPAVATPPCSLRFRCPVKPGACPRAGTVRRYEPECCALGHVAARVRPTLRGSRAGIPSVSSANRSGASGTAGAVTKQHAAQPKNPPPLSEPAASRTSDRALPKSCDDRATDKELSGNAKAAFITDCRNENAQPEKAASSPPLTNAQSSELQDQQFQKWDAAARRAMGSICVGCDRPVRVGRSPARQAPVVDRDDFQPE
jgi:hypothetical protein